MLLPNPALRQVVTQPTTDMYIYIYHALDYQVDVQRQMQGT